VVNYNPSTKPDALKPYLPSPDGAQDEKCFLESSHLRRCHLDFIVCGDIRQFRHQNCFPAQRRNPWLT
jgi:hypothetical protein